MKCKVKQNLHLWQIVIYCEKLKLLLLHSTTHFRKSLNEWEKKQFKINSKRIKLEKKATNTKLSKRWRNPSATVRWIIVKGHQYWTSKSYRCASVGVPPLWHTRLFVTGLPDLSAPALPSDSHPDRPSCQQKLDSAPGTEMQQRDQVSVGPFTEIYTKRNFCAVGLYSWLAEEREGQEYLVTRTNAWECNKNGRTHNWRTVYVCLWQTVSKAGELSITTMHWHPLQQFPQHCSGCCRLLWTTVGGNLIYGWTTFR